MSVGGRLSLVQMLKMEGKRKEKKRRGGCRAEKKGKNKEKEEVGWA